VKIALITGSCGLVGSECVNFFIKKKFKVIGIDNNLRQFFFGKYGSTLWIKKKLENDFNKQYQHFSIDIRNYKKLDSIFKKYKKKSR
jgi:CDP-paratose 2-epimerase